MSSYDEHLISQAGGDGDELDQIQRRVDKATVGPWNGARANANTDFVAHARTDVPYLLALVREQQAKLDELRDLANVADINDQQFGDGNGGSLSTEAIRAALESKP